MRTANTKRRARPDGRVNHRVASNILQSIQSSKGGRRWELLVGYTLSDLMKHLERQFLPGMTWENMSLWHIDHILPLASFSFESADSSEFRAAWALSNLRPLWAGDNLKKRAARLHLL